MGKELALRESAVLSKVGFSPKTKRCIEEQRVDRQVSAGGRRVWWRGFSQADTALVTS